jgi:hypothetical protein
MLSNKQKYATFSFINVFREKSSELLTVTNSTKKVNILVYHHSLEPDLFFLLHKFYRFINIFDQFLKFFFWLKLFSHFVSVVSEKSSDKKTNFVLIATVCFH